MVKKKIKGMDKYYTFTKSKRERYYNYFYYFDRISTRFLYAIFVITMLSFLIGVIVIYPYQSLSIANCLTNTKCNSAYILGKYLISSAFYIPIIGMIIGRVIITIGEFYKLPSPLLVSLALDKLVWIKLNRNVKKGSKEDKQIKKHTYILKKGLKIMRSDVYPLYMREIFNDFYKTFNIFFMYFYLSNKQEFSHITKALESLSKSLKTKKIIKFDIYQFSIGLHKLKLTYDKNLPSHLKLLKIKLWDEFNLYKFIKHPIVLVFISVLLGGLLNAILIILK